MTIFGSQMSSLPHFQFARAFAGPLELCMYVISGSATHILQHVNRPTPAFGIRGKNTTYLMVGKDIQVHQEQCGWKFHCNTAISCSQLVI
jgi:hypothetical protein